MIGILKLYFSMYQKEKDPHKRDEIKKAMQERLKGKSFVYAPPRGRDDEFMEIMKTLGYQVDEKPVVLDVFNKEYSSEIGCDYGLKEEQTPREKWKTRTRRSDEFGDLMKYWVGPKPKFPRPKVIKTTLAIQQMPLCLPAPKRGRGENN